MCNSHVLECPFCTNNSMSLDCQECVEKVLEDDFGFKVHNSSSFAMFLTIVDKIDWVSPVNT